MSMKKKIVISGAFAALFMISGIAMFCLNPPNPESVVTEELQLDHANKCVK